MEKQESSKVTPNVVKKFLAETGFILEMEVAEMLIKKGFEVKVNQYFYDYETDKKREIDIVCSKTINKIEIILIIECKQSLIDDWIFICSDKKPKRYYDFVKYQPKVLEINNTKIFDHLPTLDDSINLAQNFIVKDKRGKKSTAMQIDTCLEKLPKALVDYAFSHTGKSSRTVYIPVAVFSGQIFVAEYNKKLVVKNKDRVQYLSIQDSGNYEYTPNYRPRAFSFEEESVEKQNSVIAKFNQFLGYRYLIEFVTKKGLSKLVSTLETDISKIDLTKWVID